MIEWYKDKELSIFFDNKPQVAMRYALPSMSEAEEKAVTKIRQKFIFCLIYTPY